MNAAPRAYIHRPGKACCTCARFAGGSVYCGTKFFVDAFTTAARHDLIGTAVRVTAISPGALRCAALCS